MKLVRPIHVVPDVYQFRVIGARVTVLMFQEGVVLVDAGSRGSLGLIASGLAALGSSLEEVRLIVLTHGHPDHAGGLARLVEATSAKVAVHRLEAGAVNGNEPFPSPHRNPLLARVTQPFMPWLYGEPVLVDYLLEDGDSLPISKDIRVIHTPGHTPGSICLHVVSQGLLIVGDALQYRFGKLLPPADLVTRDPQQALESLKKLASLPFHTIGFSHFPPYGAGAHEALQRLANRVAS